MAFTANIRSGYIAKSTFDGNDTVVLQNAGVYATDENDSNVEASAIYLTVTDAEDNVDILVNEISSTVDYVYYVDEIDLTGYPTGDITLAWNMTVSGVSLSKSQTVEYSSAIPVNITAASVASKTNRKVYLDSAHSFNIVLENSMGVPIDCNSARVVFYDSNTGSDVETQSASLSTTGSGLWTLTHTLSSATYGADLRRYQFYWQVKVKSGSSWTTVNNSTEWLEVYPAISEVQSGSLGFCTVQELRTSFPFADDALDQYAVSQSERDLILQQLISNVSEEIHERTKGNKARNKVALLRQWCINQCMVDLMTTYAPAYGRFADTNLQIKHLKQKVWRVKQSIFGRLRELNIGGV